MFRTVGLIGREGDARVAQTFRALVGLLARRGVTVLLDAQSTASLEAKDLPRVAREELGRRCQLIIIVAGDGTFLGAARSLVDLEVPLLGVNLGRLGFLTDLMPDEMEAGLEDILAGRFQEDERELLRASVYRGGHAFLSEVALNEVVIHKWNIARLIELTTHIDGRLLNTQRSDGLIIATPTGSTAYALSGGGPILYPNLAATVIVPICPHTLSSRPIVVSARSRIEVLVATTPTPEAQLTCDGQVTLELQSGDRVCIERHPRPIRLIHPPGHDYFATLRAKLRWGHKL